MTYSELICIPNFKERFDSIRIGVQVGSQTFGWNRYLNQRFYTSPEWRRFRRDVILRDNGCDLACQDRPIGGTVYIHHIEPITLDDVINLTDKLMNPENAICVSLATHNAIHYGDYEQIANEIIERKEGDTCPWKKGGAR